MKILRNPLSRRQRRICAVVLVVLYMTAYILFLVVPHFTVFGWKYCLGSYIYGANKHPYFGYGPTTLILSHTGQYIYQYGNERTVLASRFFKRIPLTVMNFDRHFEDNTDGWAHGVSPERLRRNNLGAWFGYIFNDSMDVGRVVCILLQNDGTLIWFLGMEPNKNAYNTNSSFKFVYGMVLDRHFILESYLDKETYFAELRDYFNEMR